MDHPERVQTARAGRILVVDSDPGSLAGTVRLLEQRGHDVVTARDEQEVEAALADGAPRVAIVEPALDGTDGFELCQSILDTCSGNRPLMVLASHRLHGRAAQERAQESGASFFIERPADDDVLFDAIELAFAEDIDGSGPADEPEPAALEPALGATGAERDDPPRGAPLFGEEPDHDGSAGAPLAARDSPPALSTVETEADDEAGLIEITERLSLSSDGDEPGAELSACVDLADAGEDELESWVDDAFAEFEDDAPTEVPAPAAASASGAPPERAGRDDAIAVGVAPLRPLEEGALEDRADAPAPAHPWDADIDEVAARLGEPGGLPSAVEPWGEAPPESAPGETARTGAAPAVEATASHGRAAEAAPAGVALAEPPSPPPVAAPTMPAAARDEGSRAPAPEARTEPAARREPARGAARGAAARRAERAPSPPPSSHSSTLPLVLGSIVGVVLIAVIVYGVRSWRSASPDAPPAAETAANDPLGEAALPMETAIAEEPGEAGPADEAARPASASRGADRGRPTPREETPTASPRPEPERERFADRDAPVQVVVADAAGPSTGGAEATFDEAEAEAADPVAVVGEGEAEAADGAGATETAFEGREAPAAVAPESETAATRPAEGAGSVEDAGVEADGEPDDAPAAALEPDPAPPAAPVGPPVVQPRVVTLQEPVLIRESRVEPRYPVAARRVRAGGAVVLRADVRADGTVSHVEVVEEPSSRLGLGRAAAEAVSKWRYRPALRDGEPVAHSVTVRIVFSP